MTLNEMLTMLRSIDLSFVMDPLGYQLTSSPTLDPHNRASLDLTKN